MPVVGILTHSQWLRSVIYLMYNTATITPYHIKDLLLMCLIVSKIGPEVRKQKHSTVLRDIVQIINTHIFVTVLLVTVSQIKDAEQTTIGKLYYV